MSNRLSRSIDCPVRGLLSWEELWAGPDQGLIYCWEHGRQKRLAEPDLAKRAEEGELVTLAWKGGTENIDIEEDGDGKKNKSQKRYGTLKYLAMWQGLRGEDLDIDLDAERVIICAKSKREVIFRARRPEQHSVKNRKAVT
jgi:hypothetical protein